jgi:hypothetical protein
LSGFSCHAPAASGSFRPQPGVRWRLAGTARSRGAWTRGRWRAVRRVRGAAGRTGRAWRMAVWVRPVGSPVRAGTCTRVVPDDEVQQVPTLVRRLAGPTRPFGRPSHLTVTRRQPVDQRRPLSHAGRLSTPWLLEQCRQGDSNPADQ